MQIAKIIVLLVILFFISGMGWKPQKPLPKPDAPEIRIDRVVCR